MLKIIYYFRANYTIKMARFFIFSQKFSPRADRRADPLNYNPFFHHPSFFGIIFRTFILTNFETDCFRNRQLKWHVHSAIRACLVIFEEERVWKNKSRSWIRDTQKKKAIWIANASPNPLLSMVSFSLKKMHALLDITRKLS